MLAEFTDDEFMMSVSRSFVVKYSTNKLNSSFQNDTEKYQASIFKSIFILSMFKCYLLCVNEHFLPDLHTVRRVYTDDHVQRVIQSQLNCM